MTAATILARMLIAALAILLIASCRWGVPRPGKPTATPAPERRLRQVRIAGDAYPDYWCMTMIPPLQSTFRHVDPWPAGEHGPRHFVGDS